MFVAVGKILPRELSTAAGTFVTEGKSAVRSDMALAGSPVAELTSPINEVSCNPTAAGITAAKEDTSVATGATKDDSRPDGIAEAVGRMLASELRTPAGRFVAEGKTLFSSEMTLAGSPVAAPT